MAHSVLVWHCISGSSPTFPGVVVAYRLMQTPCSSEGEHYSSLIGPLYQCWYYIQNLWLAYGFSLRYYELVDNVISEEIWMHTRYMMACNECTQECTSKDILYNVWIYRIHLHVLGHKSRSCPQKITQNTRKSHIFIDVNMGGDRIEQYSIMRRETSMLKSLCSEAGVWLPRDDLGGVIWEGNRENAQNIHI